jgi:hypothetical protein
VNVFNTDVLSNKANERRHTWVAIGPLISEDNTRSTSYIENWYNTEAIIVFDFTYFQFNSSVYNQWDVDRCFNMRSNLTIDPLRTRVTHLWGSPAEIAELFNKL